MAKETYKKYFNVANCRKVKKTDGNNVNGKTVVATVPLKKGDLVCYVCGTFYLDDGPYKPCPGEIHGNKVDEAFSFIYDEDVDSSVDPGLVHASKTNKGTKHISGFINHSCKPNCKIVFDQDEKMLKIIAKDKIDVGDEITIFYGNTWFDRRGIFCQCGEDNCKFCKEKTLNSEEIKAAKEGEKEERKINAYKRNRKLRDQVAQKFRYRCQVCGKQLKEMYGEFGANLIHVHHVVPLATRKGRSSETKLEDLIPICPNCHAVLHHMEEYPTAETIKRLKKTIEQRQNRKE